MSWRSALWFFLDLAINPLLHWGKPTSATHDIRSDESRGWLLNGLDLLQSSFLHWDRLRNWKPLVSPSILAGVTFLGVEYIASRIPRGRIKSPASFFFGRGCKMQQFVFYFNFIDFNSSFPASSIREKIQCNECATRWARWLEGPGGWWVQVAGGYPASQPGTLCRFPLLAG